MKKNEALIICQLRQNARMSLTKMSRKTSIPVSTLFEKLKSYNGNIVKKYTALIDFNAFGYSTRANLFLKVDKENKEEVKEYLMKNPRVNSLYRVNNGYDFMVEGIFRNIKDVEDFLDSLEAKFCLREKQVYFVVDELKREEFLSDYEIMKFIGLEPKLNVND